MNVPTIQADRLARLRQLCLEQPDANEPNAEEKVAWGDPTWRIRGGKMFAMQKGNVPGHRPSLWLAAPAGAQSFLVEGDPERFFVPPYVGGQGWVGVWMDAPRIDWQMLGELIEQAYAFVAAASGKAVRKRQAKK